jgi:CDP-6-deoxy-D-xylo-4-hexulose-3-dehydrase
MGINLKKLSQLIKFCFLLLFLFFNNTQACDESLRIKGPLESHLKARYPTTGRVFVEGFPDFLERNLSASRHNLKLFAEELSAAFGPQYITLVNSGSSANLIAASMAKERMGGGHAIVSGFTFPTTLSSLIQAGFEVTLVDVEKDGFNLDPQAVERAIRPDTKVVVVTHFLGFPAAIDRLFAITNKHGIMMIQDACETMAIRINGKKAYEFGGLTTWSFYHPHHLSAYGGGAVISNSEDDFLLAESLSHWGRACSCHVNKEKCKAPHGRNHNFWYERLGYNLELSELNAAFGRYQLQTFVDQEKMRILHYQILFDALKENQRVKVYPLILNSGISAFVFPITLKAGQKIESIATKLAQFGVEIRSLMGGSIADHAAFQSLSHDGLANTREMGSTSFFVGIHQTLSTADVRAVANILKSVLK